MATKTKRKSSKRQLKPRTQEPTPQSQRIFFTKAQTGGVWVTPDTALTYAAYWACVKYISDSISSMPLDHRQKRDGGGSEALQTDSNYLLNVQANPETQADVFRKVLIAHALNWGNGYAEIERTLTGRPAWLWQITPDRVKVDRTLSGQLIYDVSNPRAPNSVLLPEDVIHFKGLGFDGLVGYAVIAYAAKSLGSAMAADTSAATLYENDSTPGGVLKHPRRMSENARKDLLDTWQKRHGGSANKRVVALLEEGLEWSQTSMPPESAQLIENRQYGPVDICRWFLVPPHKVGILDRATFSNIESQQIQAVTDCLMPWIITIEKELNVKLIGRNLRGTQFFKHEMKSLLRADSQQRGQLYQLLLDRGVESINDVLELEDMNPIGSDGDKRFVQRNMITLDQAGMPEPAPASPASPKNDMPQDPMPKKDMPDEPMMDGSMRPDVVLAPVIRDVIKRMLIREQKHDKSQSVQSVSDYQTEYARTNLPTSIEALVKLAGVNGSSAFVARQTIDAFNCEYARHIAARYGQSFDVDETAATYTTNIVILALALAGASHVV